MEATRNVILDLLPLYLADEISEDTRALVDEYLETDPDLAKLAKQSAALELRKEIPVPLTKEDKMKTYTRARWITFLYIIVIAGLISATLLAVLAAYLISN